MIRVGIAAILFVHGRGNLNVGLADVISNFTKNEFAPRSFVQIYITGEDRRGLRRLDLFRFLAVALTIGSAKIFRQRRIFEAHKCFFKEGRKTGYSGEPLLSRGKLWVMCNMVTVLEDQEVRRTIEPSEEVHERHIGFLEKAACEFAVPALQRHS